MHFRENIAALPLSVHLGAIALRACSSSLIIARALTLTLTLGRPAREGQAELLGLIAAMAADALEATAGA